MAVVICIFAVAAFMDWRYYRIPNICVIAGMAAGMAMAYAAESWMGPVSAAARMVVIFMALYPLYLLGGLGAGDVKLFMAAGCCIRGDMLLSYMLVTMAMAGVVSLLKMAVYAESRGRLAYLARYIRKAAVTGAVDEYEVDRTRKRCMVRLALPAFAGLLAMYTGICR